MHAIGLRRANKEKSHGAIAFCLYRANIAGMKLSEWLGLERGRGAALASGINVSPVLISQWSSGPRLPPIERCVGIERATAGEVTRRDLRPADWQDIWPELAPANRDQPAIESEPLPTRVPPGITPVSDRRLQGGS